MSAVSRCQLLVVSVLNTARCGHSTKLPEFDTPINSGYDFIENHRLPFNESYAKSTDVVLWVLMMRRASCERSSFKCRITNWAKPESPPEATTRGSASRSLQ